MPNSAWSSRLTATDGRRHSNGRIAGHLAHQVGAFHLRNRARLLDELRRIDLPGRDDAAHDAGRAQHARQRARVDVGDGDDVVARSRYSRSVPSAR